MRARRNYTKIRGRCELETMWGKRGNSLSHHCGAMYRSFILQNSYKRRYIKRNLPGAQTTITLMIVVDTPSEVNTKETKAQLTTTAGALDMRGFD